MNIRRSMILIVPLLFMTGCAVGPDFVRPGPPPVTGYTHEKAPRKTIAAAGEAQHLKIGEKIAENWSRLFKSPELDAIIRSAVDQNPNLQSALWTLQQSRDNLKAGYGVFFPQADASFNASRQKFSPAEFGARRRVPF